MTEKAKLLSALERELIGKNEIKEAISTLEANPGEDDEALATLREVLKEHADSGQPIRRLILATAMTLLLFAPAPAQEKDEIVRRRPPQVYVCVDWKGQITLRPHRQIFELCWVPNEKPKEKTLKRDLEAVGVRSGDALKGDRHALDRL